jgi:transcriptional regulator with XRE-family HTH domain
MYPNLKLQLWKSGIRQNRLAKMLDIDETALSRIVNGFREPSVALQASIAALLGCEAAWLFLSTPEIKTESANDEKAVSPSFSAAATSQGNG